MRDCSLVLASFFLTCLGCLPSPINATTWAQQGIIQESWGRQTNTILIPKIMGLAQAPSAETPLKLGTQGEAVEQLQTKLKQLGYFQGEVDGFYGEETQLAVKELQKSEGVKADGVVGENTWKLLANKPTRQRSDDYDRYMSSGYRANQKRDYAQALEFFQQALAERPNDFYAKNAIRNVESYIDRQSNASGNFLWLLLVLLAAIASIGGGLWILRNKSRKASQKLAWESIPERSRAAEADFIETEVSAVANPSQVNNTPVRPGLNPNPLSSSSSQGKEESLTVGQTTRLSKVDAVNELISDLTQPDPNKRRKAIWELARRSDSRAVQPLVELMVEADSKERGLILEALSQIGTRTLKPMNQALAMSLQDENPEVRINAIRDLTRIYELVSQISKLLSHAAEDTDSEVQETAKWALKQLNHKIPTSFERLSGGRNNSINNSINSADHTN